MSELFEFLTELAKLVQTTSENWGRTARAILLISILTAIAFAAVVIFSNAN